MVSEVVGKQPPVCQLKSVCLCTLKTFYSNALTREGGLIPVHTWEFYNLEKLI